MKINRSELSEVLLSISLLEFQNVPPENEIEHVFSQAFQANVREISKKSESIMWRVWRPPLKRVLLIVILVALIMVAIACATPPLREAIIDFFLVDKGENYSVTFDPEKAANAPRIIENYRIPTYSPESYTLAYKTGNNTTVRYIWTDNRNNRISYCQVIIPEDVKKDTWMGIDAEETNRTAQSINGYRVEIISSEADQQFVAVWTDNRYIYMVEITGDEPKPESILEALMVSIVEVDTVN